jgi:MFS transporter, PPP family, 3-phenylpropionic acid transporter
MRYKTAIRSSYFFCLFAMGSAFPFLPVFLKERLGLSNIALGLVLMVRPAMAILGQPFWSWMADSTRKRSHLASFLALMSAILFPLVLMGHRLPAVMLLLALSAFFVMPLNSMSDTITFDYLGESRRNHFGIFRIFASLGFFTAVMLVGPIYDRLGLRWLFLLFALGMLGSAWVIREVPSRRGSQPQNGFGWDPLLAFLKKRNVLFFLVAILVSETANQMAYIFLSLYAKSIGANNTQTGWIWASATAMEMLTMIAMPRIIRRMGLRRILILGTFFVLFRWAPVAFIHHWWLIFPFQCFHMITLTFIYVGAAIFMDAEASPSIRFTAQAFFSTFILNGSSLLGSLLGGEISQRFGYQTLYLVCGFLGVIAAAIMFSFVHTPMHVRLPGAGSTRLWKRSLKEG